MSRKKVLIITYYWPPAGGPGVQRVVKFVKYLDRLGWQPVILTVKASSSPAQDKSLLENIPVGCTVYKTAVFEPFGVYKFFTGKKRDAYIPKDIIVQKKNDSWREKTSRWLRANLFIPDARIGWIPFLVREGMRIIKHEKPSVIFSTSPPHSLQIGARILAKRSGLKWIADFRDPWDEAYWESEIGKTALSAAINRWFEKSVLKQADIVTTVSPGIVGMLRAKQAGRYEYLYNGYEALNGSVDRSARFRIIFIGNLSKYQSPATFIAALKHVPPEYRKQIDVYFIGKVFDDYKKLMKDANIILKNYMPYNELMDFCNSASLLLLIFHQTSYSANYITAKLFDYLALRKPILAIGFKDSIGEKILTETESGALFGYDQTRETSEFIIQYFTKWKEGDSLLLPPNDKLKEYSTEDNVARLISFFESMDQQ